MAGPVRSSASAFLLLALAACSDGQDSGARSGAAAGAEPPVLNVYNWSDYIADNTLAQFEAESGIKVNYDVFDSNEVLEAKLLTGNTGYDIVVPTASFMERQIKAGAFAKLDRSKLTNYENLDPEILARVALHDPGNEYGVPYLWGTSGLGYNVQKITAIDPQAPLDSWRMLFDPQVVAKFAACGVVIMDAPTEVYAAVQAYLGGDPNSNSADDLARVEEQLMKVRPYVRYIHSSQQINDLANGEICLAMGWNGDMLQARERADEAGQGIEVSFTAVPKEGTIIWFDMLAIPVDARHKDNAHKFINFLLRPQIIADISNFRGYANPNKAATPLVDEEITSDPGIYPPAEVREKLFPDLAETPEFTRKLTRTWTRFKTGR